MVQDSQIPIGHNLHFPVRWTQKQTQWYSELMMELPIMNPVYAVEPGVRTITCKSNINGTGRMLRRAKQWLEDCFFNHMKCSANEGANPTPKPKRLLDVTIRGPNRAPRLRVIDGDSLDPFTEYVSLSHCWGMLRDPTSKRTRLHGKTLSAIRQGVAYSSLPQTFANASHATIKLTHTHVG